MLTLQRLLLFAALSVMGCGGLIACGKAGNEKSGNESASEKKASALNGEGFSVRMPGDPKRSTETVHTRQGPVRVMLYIAEDGDEAYSLSVARMPHGADPDLNGAINGSAAKVDGTVQERKHLTYQGFPARDARITGWQDDNGSRGTAFIRVIAAHGRLYQLQLVRAGADVKPPPDEYAAFLASLRIRAT